MCILAATSGRPSRLSPSVSGTTPLLSPSARPPSRSPASSGVASVAGPAVEATVRGPSGSSIIIVSAGELVWFGRPPLSPATGSRLRRPSPAVRLARRLENTQAFQIPRVQTNPAVHTPGDLTKWPRGSQPFQSRYGHAPKLPKLKDDAAKADTINSQVVRAFSGSRASWRSPDL
jgi:hypothetical protein